MWSDNEATIDLLQFKYLASTVVRLVKTPHLLPTTIGVFGDWGSGKSSLLKMVQADLQTDPTILCLTFNGWLFEGYEDAKTALMGTILDAIQERAEADKSFTTKGRDLLTKLRKRVNWLQAVGLAGRYAFSAITGVPPLAPPSTEELTKLINEAPDGPENLRRNIRDFRSDFATLLREAKINTLTVFIDDLDRCLPDTIIETLEAIKLFLFVDGTAFVLGADQRLVEYAVRQRFPELPGTETEVGRDYLEKLVQIPVRIPPLSGAEIEAYINLLFAQLDLPAADYKKICDHVAQFRASNVSEVSFNMEAARRLLSPNALPVQLESDLDLTAQVAPILTPGLGGNPRRTKRFLNMLLLRMALSQERGLTLQRQVLTKLMLLEYLKPEFFRQLAQLQTRQEGKPAELDQLETVLRQPLTVAPDEGSPSSPAESTNAKPPTTTNRLNQRVVAKRPLLAEDQLSADVQPWLADGWMRAWLSSDPPLKDIDLRPYFYIAHDNVGALDALHLRLSPAASEVLNRLLDPKEATQMLGLTRAATLSTPDATALFQSLAQRIRQSEVLDGRSPQAVLFKLMAHRPELVPQLVTLYASLPETKITLATPGLLYEVTKDTPSEIAARELLDRWSRSSQQRLARAVQEIITRAGKKR